MRKNKMKIVDSRNPSVRFRHIPSTGRIYRSCKRILRHISRIEYRERDTVHVGAIPSQRYSNFGKFICVPYV